MSRSSASPSSSAAASASSAAVDLRSDTVTRPGPEMRRAMASAEVADDVLEKDPTVGRLEARVADALGKEAALFFPSGTQANQAAIQLHARPGTEAVCEEEAHVFHYELADAALLSGVQLHTVSSDRGRVDATAFEDAVRPDDRYHPDTSLLCTENTHNLHGGVVVPLERLRAVREVARRHALPVHLDGARLWNATVASGASLEAYGDTADTVMVTLSKGLGCPAGSLLAGTAAAMESAWTIRKRLGGGMRQVGVLAAAGLHALDRGLESLAEDHRRARRLAEGCAAVTGLSAETPETNIVMIAVEGDRRPERLSRRLEERDVLILPAGPRRLRAVTHRDVDDADVERALEALEAVAAA